jgi:hypothetical protein
MSIAEEQNIETYMNALIARDNKTISLEQFRIAQLKYHQVIEDIRLKEFPAEHFNEYGVCRHCSWRSEFPHSHAIHSTENACKYMETYFDITFDEDGDVFCNKKH